MSAVEVPRIERPRRQSRFRSADMTADRSGGTSTGYCVPGDRPPFANATAVDVPSGCVCAGIRTTVERTGVRWASCRPSMRVCPDIPASTQYRPTFYAASTDEDRSTSPISRHAYGRTATAHNPSMDRTALPAQPGNTQNVFAAGGSGWVHGWHHCGRSPNRLSDTSRKTSGLCPFRPPALQNLRRLT